MRGRTQKLLSLHIRNIRRYVLILILLTPAISLAKGERSDIELLPEVLSLQDEHARSGIFFGSQNEDKMPIITRVLMDWQEAKGNRVIKPPTIEFKKINPTKYRVRVHGATEDFPLIFSESYHDGWKAYLVRPQIPNSKSQTNSKLQIHKYKILEGNEEDQASPDELRTYMANGWVSTLGDGKKIDFISKNLKGTIQNNNLSNGRFYETWFEEHLSDDFHWVVNGYANSWWIRLDDLKKTNRYVESPDCSVDFEAVIEFWPQQLFYIGLFISGLTLLCCLLFLFYGWIKKGQRSNEK